MNELVNLLSDFIGLRFQEETETPWLNYSQFFALLFCTYFDNGYESLCLVPCHFMAFRRLSTPHWSH